MQAFAEAFVSGSAEERQFFDFGNLSPYRLDDLVDLFSASSPSDEVVQSMTVSMGAYLGEVIVRTTGGSWTYLDGMPGVRGPGGLTCFPLNKVGKRLTEGPHHSITQFYEAAVRGELPPEAYRVPGL